MQQENRKKLLDIAKEFDCDIEETDLTLNILADKYFVHGTNDFELIAMEEEADRKNIPLMNEIAAIGYIYLAGISQVEDYVKHAKEQYDLAIEGIGKAIEKGPNSEFSELYEHMTIDKLLHQRIRLFSAREKVGDYIGITKIFNDLYKPEISEERKIDMIFCETR